MKFKFDATRIIVVDILHYEISWCYYQVIRYVTKFSHTDVLPPVLCCEAKRLDVLI